MWGGKKKDNAKTRKTTAGGRPRESREGIWDRHPGGDSRELEMASEIRRREETDSLLRRLP